MRKEGLDDVPVVVGGIIPPEDAATLKGLASPPSTRPRTSSSTPSWRDIVRLVDRLAKAA